MPRVALRLALLVFALAIGVAISGEAPAADGKPHARESRMVGVGRRPDAASIP